MSNPNDNYDWDSDGQSGRGISGNYVARANAGVQLLKPSWKRTETVFRPYPRPADDKLFDPYRIIDNEGRNRFSDWIRRYNCAWSVGNPATTFLIPRPTDLGVNDPSRSPLGILSKAIYNAAQKQQLRPEWTPLVLKTHGQSKQLTPPKTCYVVQGAVLRHNNKDYFGRNGEPLGWGRNPPCVFLISGGAGDTLCDMLKDEIQGYTGAPTNFEKRYKYGDPVAINHGRFFHFFEKGSAPANRYVSQPTSQTADSSGWGSGPGSARTDTKRAEYGFDVFIDNNFEGVPAAFDEVGAQMIRSKWREWRDVLYLPTETEQAHLLARCMPISACIYAFEGVNRDWLPEDAYHKAANAVQAQVPQNYPVGGYPPAPAYAPTGFAGPVPAGFGTPAPQQPKVQSWTGPSKLDTTVPSHNDADPVDSALGFGQKSAKSPEPQAPMSGATADALAKMARAQNEMN